MFRNSRSSVSNEHIKAWKLRVATVRTYLKKSRNDNKVVSKEVRSKRRSAKTFEIQMQAGCSKFEIYALEHSKTPESEEQEVNPAALARSIALAKLNS